MKPVLVTLAHCVVLLFHATAYADDDLTVPPNEPVAGLSQAEWSRAWWQWAASFSDSESPVADRSGKFCDRKQDGAVWFLAGTYEVHRTVRTCKVPRGKYLFFPLINHVVMPSGAGRPSCAEVTDEALLMTDGATALILDVDGQRIENLAAHRQATTECFDLGARTPDKLRVFPSAANGYYVMLKPLKPGKHVINFGGLLPGTAQAVTYTLTVE